MRADSTASPPWTRSSSEQHPADLKPVFAADLKPVFARSPERHQHVGPLDGPPVRVASRRRTRDPARVQRASRQVTARNRARNRPSARAPRAVELALEGMCVREIAAELGVHRVTVWRTLTEPTAAARLADLTAQRQRRAALELSELVEDALGLLGEIVRDAAAPPAVRLRAAEAVLDRAGIGPHMTAAVSVTPEGANIGPLLARIAAQTCDCERYGDDGRPPSSPPEEPPPPTPPEAQERAPKTPSASSAAPEQQALNVGKVEPPTQSTYVRLPSPRSGARAWSDPWGER